MTSNPHICRFERGETSIEDAIAACAKSRAADRRADGVVYTPERIAREMVKMSGVRRDDEVWEPSCGHGAFVFPLLNAARIFCESGGGPGLVHGARPVHGPVSGDDLRSQSAPRGVLQNEGRVGARL